jgi:RimJ/RimL family protein N-acetyltransferase
MGIYRSLERQIFKLGKYSIVPIRYEDRYDIMKWRNEQIYHLRQDRPLTRREQDNYFENIITKIFEQDQPNQILFSYLENSKCIGYGGLVHINWIDKNAEISFIMETELEENYFELHWKNFLCLIESVAFNELLFHKIFTYAFDIREHLYPVLEKRGFRLEAELKEHCYFQDGFKSVKIHSKIHREVELRKAEIFDFEITYEWANDSKVRAYSYNKNKISHIEHSDWFLSRLDSKDCEYYILMYEGKPCGSIRFDIEDEVKARINYLIDPKCTGQGLGTLILLEGLKYLQKNLPLIQRVYGFVLHDNIASKKIFKKLSFTKVSDNEIEVKYEKKLK